MKTEEQRFFENIEINEGGCWLWLGSIIRNGYGRFFVDGKYRLAHRVSYQWFVGEIPEELQIDHLCRIRKCVNFIHLEVVTGRENVRRGNTGMHQKIKTSCPQGHEYDDENTKIYKNTRSCRECIRVRDRERYWRLKNGTSS